MGIENTARALGIRSNHGVASSEKRCGTKMPPTTGEELILTRLEGFSGQSIQPGVADLSCSVA
jgi:hypothetical protein